VPHSGWRRTLVSFSSVPPPSDMAAVPRSTGVDPPRLDALHHAANRCRDAEASCRPWDARNASRENRAGALQASSASAGAGCVTAGKSDNTRSGLKNIRDRAGSHFFVVQGERNAVDPGSMSDEQRMWKYELWPRLFGLRPEIGANGVAALGNTSSIPCARRLAQKNRYGRFQGATRSRIFLRPLLATASNRARL